jgi:hypothetical protein
MNTNFTSSSKSTKGYQTIAFWIQGIESKHLTDEALLRYGKDCIKKRGSSRPHNQSALRITKKVKMSK